MGTRFCHYQDEEHHVSLTNQCLLVDKVLCGHSVEGGDQPQAWVGASTGNEEPHAGVRGVEFNHFLVPRSRSSSHDGEYGQG